jgi:DeoR/GlpR family transcriptional regulator of sugar metabolism
MAFGDFYMSKEREKSILEALLVQKRATVKELSQKLYISPSSIRRDLASLEKQDLIKRTHGGAMITDNILSSSKIPFMIREYEESNAKVEMAKKAIELVKDNDVIFLDASTSAYNLIPFLVAKSNIVVITNSVRALNTLAQFNISTVSTGGSLIASCMALVGEEAYKTIDSFKADVFFFSCRGLSDDGELTDIHPSENYVRARMMANAKRSYLLCAKNKFGKSYYHKLCHKDELDGVITND